MKRVTRIPPAPPRPADAHKGSFGTVIVVGGSDTMIGAPALAASAALRGGAGLVKLAVPTAILPYAITIEPGATGIAMGSNADACLAAIDAADEKGSAVLAIGPGLGRSSFAGDLVLKLLGGRRTTVLDADGLNLLAATGKPRPAKGPPLVLTPHPGEFARLIKPLRIQGDPADVTARPKLAAELASAHDAIVVLKGRRTVVTDGRRVYVNATGNPALATAGSGDVLTGLVAALVAQGMSPFDAAALGSHLHGLAADLWAKQHGPSGLTARDLANALPDAFERHRRKYKLR